MIILFGGTCETAPLAEMIAEAGYRVLVSTATPIDLDTGRHRRIRRRIGGLDAPAMIDLIRKEQIRAVVDAAHPYAQLLHVTVARVCETLGIRLLRYERPDVPVPDIGQIQWAADHREAAALACRPDARVLLTIGSRHIAPYVKAADEHRATLFARVLPEKASFEACRAAALSRGQVIGKRGPFSRKDNLKLLHRLGIDVLVTKESGAAGGFGEKIEAAIEKKCRVVIVQRPAQAAGTVCRSFHEIIKALAN